MKKLAIAFAGLAAIGLSGAAFAEEATITTTGPAAMTDSEMDKVTAGSFLRVCGGGDCQTPPRGLEVPGSPPPTLTNREGILNDVVTFGRSPY